MLKVLEDKNGIKNAQETLETTIEKISDEKIPVTIGYQGGNAPPGDVSYSRKHNLWFYRGGEIGESGRKRYWNAFGLNKPKEKSWPPIVVEINPPVEGIYRRVSGVFAIDDKEKIFLLHRGRIGGGRPGIGQNSFLRHYGGEKSFIQEGQKVSDEPNSTNWLHNFTRFSRKIERIYREGK